VITVNTSFSYLSSAELTDVGRRRKNNEDSLIRLPDAGVFCVADGMGGVQGGEVASKAVVDFLGKDFTESPEAGFAVTADASVRLVERALNAASHWIKERAEGLGLNGTGSTVVVLAFDKVTPSQGVALHAGDSRAYRLRGDKMVQLTTDHSVAAAAGLPDDSSLPAMFRGVITRAVGLDSQVQLEATPFDVAPGDVFLLCSDGLSKMVSDRRIQKLLRKHQDDPLEEAAKALVNEALDEGGEDNVSVVIIRVAPEIPRGPTMEIPPETLALEQLVVAMPPPVTPRLGDERDDTGQTAETGGARDTACTLADDQERAEQVTPTTPDGEGKGGTTPVTPPASRSGGRSATHTVTGGSWRKWFWFGLGLLGVAGAAAWGYLEWRATRTIVPPRAEAGSAESLQSVSSQTGETASLKAAEETNESVQPLARPASGSELHGGVSE
jgi:protein phosphatase